MARLEYTSGTSYNRKESITITTPFDINNLFQSVIDNPSIPLTGKDKGLNESVNGIICAGFQVKYNHAKASELLESTEFHNAVDNHESSAVLARLKKEPRDVGSGTGGPRSGNGGITNALRQEIGTLIIGALCVKCDIPASEVGDYEITANWVADNIGVSESIEKPKRRVKNDKERVGALTVKVVMALHNAGISAEEIANDDDLDLSVDQVNEIISA